MFEIFRGVGQRANARFGHVCVLPFSVSWQMFIYNRLFVVTVIFLLN